MVTQSLVDLTVVTAIDTLVIAWVVWRLRPAGRAKPLPYEATPLGATRYVITWHRGKDVFTRYDGPDSDKAYATWMEMETKPSLYPGAHRWTENDHIRVHKLHSEVV